jgi:hypothetical protein
LNYDQKNIVDAGVVGKLDEKEPKKVENSEKVFVVIKIMKKDCHKS